MRSVERVGRAVVWAISASCMLVAFSAASTAAARGHTYIGDIIFDTGNVTLAGQPVQTGGNKSWDTHNSLGKISVGDVLIVPQASDVEYIVHVGKRKAFCDTRPLAKFNGEVTITGTPSNFMKFNLGLTYCATAPAGGPKRLVIGPKAYAYATIQHDPVFEITATPGRSVVKVRRGLLVVAGVHGKAEAVVVGKNQKTTVPSGSDPAATSTAPPATGTEKKVVQQVSAPLPPPPVDTKGPATTIVGEPHDPSSLHVGFFSFASESNATYSCALDGSDFRFCTNPVKFNIEPGPHTLQVKATDTAGNTGPTTGFSWTVDNSRIAFETSRDGKSQIYTIDSAGGDLQHVSDGAANDYDPAWSPDGKQIAFHSDRAGPCQIYVMDAAGGNITRVTQDSEQDTNPAWSSTGMIAYENDVTTLGKPCEPDTTHRQHNDIYTTDLSGKSRFQLTNDPADDIDPSWSPDGTHVAFASNRTGTYQIYVVDANGKGLTQLTNAEGFQQFSPSWSPDGKQIAFLSTREGNAEIFVMNADGSDQRPVARSLQESYNPTWAPDGQELAFQSQNGTPGGTWRIYWSTLGAAASLSGGGAAAVTAADYSALAPDWSPGR
jgi:WD40 repeat protein